MITLTARRISILTKGKVAIEIVPFEILEKTLNQMLPPTECRNMKPVWLVEKPLECPDFLSGKYSIVFIPVAYFLVQFDYGIIERA